MNLNWRFWERGGAALETRDTFTELLLQAQGNAAITVRPRPLALAVIETCVSLIADPFLQATVTVDGLRLTPGLLYELARDVLTSGNGVRLIDLDDAGRIDLARPAEYEIAGRSPYPRGWAYLLTMAAPSGETTRRATYDALVHVRTATLASSPWDGRAAWQCCGLSADALAVIEGAIKDEASVGNGRLWIAPDGVTQLQASTMAGRIRTSRGGQAVVESMRAGQGRGAAAAPATDWVPVKTGQDQTAGNAAMRESIEASISAAYGVPASYLNENATAPAITNVKRAAFLNKTMPLRDLIVAELSEKLARPVSVTWPNHADQSVDLAQRAAAAQRLASLPTPPENILEIVGLQ